MSFHVRLVSTRDRTEHLVEALARDPGVSNLVVLAGSARRPDGDAVQFDVQPGSANSVLRQLEAFTGDRRTADHRRVAWTRPSATRHAAAQAPSRAARPRPGVGCRRSQNPLRCRLRAQFLHPAGHSRADRCRRHPDQFTDPHRRRHGRGPGIQRDHGRRARHRQAHRPPVLRGALALLAGFTAAIILTLIFGLVIRWSGHTPQAYLLGVRPVST